MFASIALDYGRLVLNDIPTITTHAVGHWALADAHVVVKPPQAPALVREPHREVRVYRGCNQVLNVRRAVPLFAHLGRLVHGKTVRRLVAVIV